MAQVDQGALPSQSKDTKDLAGFGYKQELHRTLGLFSSFAAAFSYISPSTGIFTLFSLGLITVGGVFIWSWPIVALGQFIVALNFAEVSSHFPIAGSVFQWTKYLAGTQLRLVHRVDLHLRRHPHRDRRRRDPAARRSCRPSTTWDGTSTPAASTTRSGSPRSRSWSSRCSTSTA